MRTVITPTTQDAAHVGSLLRHLHAVTENDRVVLARKMHDEMGGLLVSAAMDLGWSETQATDPALKARLRRLGLSLGSAVHMERQIIEQLRPTLLDTIGLFEALRWYFKHACLRMDGACRVTLPSDEMVLEPLALSNIFRATQTLIDCTFAEPDLRTVALEAVMQDDAMHIRLTHQHSAPDTVEVLNRFEFELGCAAHRVHVFGGELSCEDTYHGLSFQLIVPIPVRVKPGTWQPVNGLVSSLA
jgi:signal transduction histidine kinase